MATRVEATGSNGRVELVTDDVTKEIARIVVEGEDGKEAYFFVSLAFTDDGKNRRVYLEVVGKVDNNRELWGSIGADFLTPVKRV